MDSSGFFQPLWKWGGHWFAQGILPLWNPDVAFGRPYWADPQMGAWYPPLRLFYEWMSPEDAFRFLVVGHQLWGALGFYLFVRDRGIPPWTALAGSLAFGFSFNSLSVMQIPAMLFAFSWIPWVFRTAWWVWERPSSGTGLAFSLALGLQGASGYPLYGYLTAFFLGLDLSIRSAFLLRNVPDQWGRVRGWAGWTLLGAGAAVFFNLAWLLPFSEFLKFSNVDQRLAMSQGIEWKHLASWLNPFFNGHPLHSFTGIDASVSVYFAGLPIVVLLLWGAFRRRVEGVTLFLFLLAFLLSTGPLLGVGLWLKDILPGFHWVVRSGYLISWVVFFGVWAALQAFEGDGSKVKGTKGESSWTWVVLATAGGALALGVPFDLPSFWCGVLAIFLAGRSFSKGRDTGRFFLGLAVLCSLGPVAQSLGYTLPVSFYREAPPCLARMTEPGRIDHEYGVIQKGEAVSGRSIQEAFDQLRGDLIPNWPLNYGREEVFDHDSFFLKDFLKWWYGAARISGAFSKKILDYLDVRYFFGTDPGPGFKRLEAGSAPDPLWVNLSSLSKWHSVTRVLPGTSWDEDMRWAAGHAFDFTKECFAEGDLRTGPYSSRRVDYSSMGPNRLEIEAVGKGRALLVSSETAFPGWVALVDGQEKTCHVVNHDFRGVLLGPGEERVTMTYRPTAVRLGLFLALLAVGLWAGLGIRGGFKAFARI